MIRRIARSDILHRRELVAILPATTSVTGHVVLSSSSSISHSIYKNPPFSRTTNTRIFSTRIAAEPEPSEDSTSNTSEWWQDIQVEDSDYKLNLATVPQSIYRHEDQGRYVYSGALDIPTTGEDHAMVDVDADVRQLKYLETPDWQDMPLDGELFKISWATSPPSLYTVCGSDNATGQHLFQFRGILNESDANKPKLDLAYDIRKLIYYPQIHYNQTGPSASSSSSSSHLSKQPSIASDISKLVFPYSKTASREFVDYAVWCAKSGVLAPKATLFFKAGAAGASGYGVLATQDIKQGEVIAVTPQLLGRLNADPMFDRLIKSLYSEAPIYLRELDLVINSLLLAYEYRMDSNSTWLPFLQTLPVPPTALHNLTHQVSRYHHANMMEQDSRANTDHPGFQENWTEFIQLRETCVKVYQTVALTCAELGFPLDWLVLDEETNKPQAHEVPKLFWLTLTQTIYHSIDFQAPTSKTSTNSENDESISHYDDDDSAIQSETDEDNQVNDRDSDNNLDLNGSETNHENNDIYSSDDESCSDFSDEADRFHVSEEEEQDQDNFSSSAGQPSSSTSSTFASLFSSPQQSDSPNSQKTFMVLPPMGTMAFVPFMDQVRHGPSPHVLHTIHTKTKTLNEKWAAKLAEYSDSESDLSDEGSEEEGFPGLEEISTPAANSELRLRGWNPVEPSEEMFRQSLQDASESKSMKSQTEADEEDEEKNQKDEAEEVGPLLVELVATRDIAKGDEILRDYIPKNAQKFDRHQRQSYMWLFHNVYCDV